MSRFIFYLLILFLPSQLGKHFWPDLAFIQGLKSDYLSPTIYLTDILIFGLFISFLPKILSNLSHLSNLRNLRIIAPATIFLITVSLFAFTPILSFLKLLKILELIFLGYYVKSELGKTISLKKIALLLLLTVFYESVLAIWQFFEQASIDGFWWFLGERTFRSSTPGIAQAIINGELILRPYGTFSHPNVLGGYFAIVLPLIIYALCHSEESANRRTTKQSLKTSRLLHSFQSLAMTKEQFFLLLITLLGIVSLFLSFSRTAWIAGAISLITLLFILLKNKIKTLVVLLAVFLIGLTTAGNIIFSRLQTLESVDIQSLVVRQQLNDIGLKIISNHPLLGIGLNNFLVTLPQFYQLKDPVRFYQPAHNIYLMIAAETGLVGLFLFLFFIFLTLRRLIFNTLIPKYLNTLILLLLAEILFLGLFDHYFYTLQQGQLLFALVLGLAWSSSSLAFPRKRESIPFLLHFATFS